MQVQEVWKWRCPQGIWYSSVNRENTFSYFPHQHEIHVYWFCRSIKNSYSQIQKPVIVLLHILSGLWRLPVNITSYRCILYICFPCIMEIWRFVHPRKAIFAEGNTQGKYDYFEGQQILISSICNGNECFIPPGQRFGEFCQM